MDKYNGVPFRKELRLVDGRGNKIYANILKDVVGQAFGISPSGADIIRCLKKVQEEDKEEVALRLIDARQKKLLLEDEFDWLKNEERACRFVWLCLKEADDDKTKEWMEVGGGFFISKADWRDQHYNRKNYFNSLVASNDISEYKNHLREIREFFDVLDVDVALKRNMMKNLNALFSEKINEKLKIEWLEPKDREQCDWVWEYLKERISISSHLKPNNDYQKYRCIVTALDFYEVGRDTKIILVQSLKKAWNQRVYRKKQADKSLLNTYISNDAKRQLEKLAERREEKIYQTLERIIRRAHDEKW